jgi:DNA-binding HxlR family transcriptional regulator
MKDMISACPAERTLQMMGGRWKVFIVWQLLTETLRFSDLQRKINSCTEGKASAVTAKMLTQELRQMEAGGLVHREVYAQVPPKVEYSLTPLGRSLRPVVEAMAEWGRAHEKETNSLTSCAPADFPL